MTANDFIQIGIYLVVLLALFKPMGSYMTHVFADQPNRITRFGGGVERFIYRLCGIKADEDMGWKQLWHRHAGVQCLRHVAGLCLSALAAVVAAEPAAFSGAEP